MPKYIERRRRGWYAVLDVPKALWGHFGKRRLIESLKTDSQKEAELRVLSKIAEWKAQIEEARTGKPSAIRRDQIAQALEWQRDYQSARGDERVMLDDILDERVEAIARRDPAKAEVFAKVVRAESRPMTQDLTEWVQSLRSLTKNKARTIDEKEANVQRFAEAFPLTHQVSKKAVKRWANEWIGEKGLDRTSVVKIVSNVRGYWDWLHDKGYVTNDADAFKDMGLKPKRSTGSESDGEARVGFTPSEVTKLLHAAQEKAQRHPRPDARESHRKLVTLIWLAMWTGCRISELCSLRVQDVTADRLKIADAKTRAGRREVPIHSRLKEAVAALKATSTDGFLISGLSADNQYKDRSAGIGKVFGRLKTDMGFGKDHVFHSIRKTVITLLFEAGVREEITADIVGHKIRSMTHGLYRDTSAIETKQNAIEGIKYEVNVPLVTNGMKDR